MVSKVRTPLGVMCLLAILILSSTCVGFAQGLGGLISGSKANSAAASAAPSDPLRRTTPKSSIYAFLEACHDQNYALAAQYMDLHRIRADEQPDLAKQLGAILDRDSHFQVGRINNTAEGNVQDGLPPDIENLDTFQTGARVIALEMQRITRDSVPIWLVSAESVAHISQLSAVTAESPLERRLPEPLVSNKLAGTPLWIWLALILLAILLSLLSRLLSRLVLAILRPLLKRYTASLHAHRVESFAEPLRLILSVVVFRASLEVLTPSALVRNYIFNLLTLLFFLGVASLAMRIADVISDQVISRMDPKQRTLSYSIIPLFVRIVKICIFGLAILFILHGWGQPTSTILAGVGVGGLAVALAAQKTLENLFGSVSLISDQPVLVGDFCQFGGQVGTVEDIGLRSTRIRTLDRTVVTIPNSVFSTMTLENYSRRDRMWFHPTIKLHRSTTPEQIRGMMDAIQKILEGHSKLDTSGVPLRFTKIADQSFDLEVFAYVMTPDGDLFLKVQSELLLAFIEAAERIGVSFAVPLQESASPSEQAKPVIGARSDGSSPGEAQKT